MQRLRFLLTCFLFILCVLLTGCFSVHTRPPVPRKAPIYHRVMSSDFEGRPIAEYIAEGEVIKTEDGYRFSAVQRRIFEPSTIDIHYPLGRAVTVQASNVIVTPAVKPLWLRNLDRDAASIQERMEFRACPPSCPNEY